MIAEEFARLKHDVESKVKVDRTSAWLDDFVRKHSGSSRVRPVDQVVR